MRRAVRVTGAIPRERAGRRGVVETGAKMKVGWHATSRGVVVLSAAREIRENPGARGLVRGGKGVVAVVRDKQQPRRPRYRTVAYI